MLSRRHAWLSITPEPERELPRAIATLRAGGVPSPEQVDDERRLAERLVLRGSRRRWQAWLAEAEDLARQPQAALGDRRLEEAGAIVLAVIDNHDALELGLPGRSRTAGARKREVIPR